MTAPMDAARLVVEVPPPPSTFPFRERLEVIGTQASVLFGNGLHDDLDIRTHGALPVIRRR